MNVNLKNIFTYSTEELFLLTKTSPDLRGNKIFYSSIRNGALERL